MSDARRLSAVLDRIDGRPYPAYRDLEGSWDLGDVELIVDRVQGDPFAAPSRVRVRTPTRVGPDLLADADKRLAAEDFLLRRFGEALPRGRRGSGRSGVLEVYDPGPEILERSALRLRRDGKAEVRFAAGLPARGRRILGRQARAMLLEDVLDAAATLLELDIEALSAHADSVARQRALRRALSEAGLVAFVADGSVLPRRSGVDPRPLPDAIEFRSPDSLRTTLSTPQGAVTGMGIPVGVTVIVGGGFHGKSTLLRAIQEGHLDHVPGDGREAVVARVDTVKVRAEDGRRVCAVDVSGFLGSLPGGQSTSPFTTDDASGSTSQAAAIVEAIEAGATTLLFDEDTSATNLLARDDRMRALIPRAGEPITPLVERIRELHDTWNTSSVIVIGGVGDFLAVADTVIAMRDFVASDVTDKAHEVGGPRPTAPRPLQPLGTRVIHRRGLEPGKIRARDVRAVRYGDTEIDLTAVEQVIDGPHAWTIGAALAFLHDNLADDRRTLRVLLDALDTILDDEGVEALSQRSWPDGLLVRPRRHEIAAALNRLRNLRVQ